MSNAQRPSVAKKHTPRTEKARDEAAEFGVSIKVDGRTYTVREADLTSLDTMALRRETGLSFIGVVQAFQVSPDIDLIAALVWLSRRIDGERMLPFASVAEDIGYNAEIDVVDAEADDSPEA